MITAIRLKDRFTRQSAADSLRLLVAELGGQLPTVSMYAQNAMAYDVKIAEEQQIVTDLDRPTPWTVGSLRYKKAGTSANDTDPTGASYGAPKIPGAAVYMADRLRLGFSVGPDQYLGVQILGGETAGPKRSEIKLGPSWAGWIDADTVWVPAIGGSAPIDEYGNIPASAISAMLSSLGANEYARRAPGATRRRNRRAPVMGEFFLMYDEGQSWGYDQPSGVFRRYTTADGEEEVEPFVWFVPRATYQSRWRFYERADAEIATKFSGYINRYLDIALERMRRAR